MLISLDCSLSPKVASFVSHNLELKVTAKKEARMKSCHDICGSFPLLDQIHMLERLVQISTVDLEDDDSAMEDEDEDEDEDENARASRASTEELLCTLPLLAKTPAAINDVRLELMYYVNHHLSKKSFLKKLHQLQLAIKRKGRSKAVARLVETRSLLETDILSACERILYEIQDHEDGASPVTLLYHEILGQVKTCLLGIILICLLGIILFVCWASFFLFVGHHSFCLLGILFCRPWFIDPDSSTMHLFSTMIH
jgi:hypothetical protein